MVVNHEYTDELLMFPTGDYSANQQRRIEMQAHGMSVLEIERNGSEGSWKRVAPRRTTLNRRVTVTTPMRLTGPAAGHRRPQTSADPTGRRVLGTLNNCAGGLTPWGTVLSGEENFDGYFEASGALDERDVESYMRYGPTAGRGRAGAATSKPVAPSTNDTSSRICATASRTTVSRSRASEAGGTSTHGST